MSEELPIITRLKDELTEFQRELNQDIPAQLEEARAHGDLKENAEYHATKERQGMLHARIGHLAHRLGELSRYTKSSIPSDKVGYGSLVEVEDLDSGERVVYELVFPEEAETSQGHVSISSPIGQAMLNRMPGDEVKVRTPSGLRNLEIIELTTIHER